MPIRAPLVAALGALGALAALDGPGRVRAATLKELSTPAWSQVNVGRLTIVGPAPASELAATGRRFERLRHAFGRVVPSARLADPVPVVVVVCRQPRCPPAGLVDRPGLLYIVLDRSRDRAEAVSVELTRRLVERSVRSVPLWLETGLSEFFRAFDGEGPPGKVTLGSPLAHHLARLGARALPVVTMLSATRESDTFTDRSRRALFDAQAWLTVHYLLVGKPSRQHQLTRFIEQHMSGVAPSVAFRTAFETDTDTFGHELRDYAAQALVRTRVETVDDDEPTEAERAVDQDDAEALVADVQEHRGDGGTARRLWQAVIARRPDHPRALAGLGRLAIARGVLAEGRRLLARAASQSGSDWQPRLDHAVALLGPLATFPERAVAVADARLAEQLLDEVLAASDGNVDALAYLGAARLAHLNPGGAAQSWMAAYTATYRQDYLLLAARAHAAGRDVAGARRLLTPLVSGGASSNIRLAARQVLDGLPAESGDAVSGVPMLRSLREGEVRELGQLEEIRCELEFVTLWVRLPGRRTIRVATRSLELVEFVSYPRATSSGSVRCGLRPGESVYVTWRPSPDAPSGTEGFVTAVEFVPTRDLRRDSRNLDGFSG